MRLKIGPATYGNLTDAMMALAALEEDRVTLVFEPVAGPGMRWQCWTTGRDAEKAASPWGALCRAALNYDRRYEIEVVE